jgi:hypothetical protein
MKSVEKHDEIILSALHVLKGESITSNVREIVCRDVPCMQLDEYKI